MENFFSEINLDKYITWIQNGRQDKLKILKKTC